MPTTLTGLLIFIVLLLPGFAYLVGKERNGTERRASPFRETAAVVAASITSELVVLGLFAGIRWQAPSSWTPDVGALIRHGGTYLRGTKDHQWWGLPKGEAEPSAGCPGLGTCGFPAVTR